MKDTTGTTSDRRAESKKGRHGEGRGTRSWRDERDVIDVISTVKQLLSEELEAS